MFPRKKDAQDAALTTASDYQFPPIQAVFHSGTIGYTKSALAHTSLPPPAPLTLISLALRFTLNRLPKQPSANLNWRAERDKREYIPDKNRPPAPVYHHVTHTLLFLEGKLFTQADCRSLSCTLSAHKNIWQDREVRTPREEPLGVGRGINRNK